MKVESGTWGEAGVFPWALAAAGLSLPACLGSPALPPPRLPALVNVLPGCEQPVSHPPGKHLWEKAVPGPRGQSQCWKGRSSSTCPVLHREDKALKKRETC